MIPAPGTSFTPVAVSIREGKALQGSCAAAAALDQPGQAIYDGALAAVVFKTQQGYFAATNLQTSGKPKRAAQAWWMGFRDRADEHGRLQFT